MTNQGFNTPRVNNLVGTLALAVADAITHAVEAVAGHGGALAAALSYLLQEPGIGIEELRIPLALTQPATVRLVNQMVAEGLVRRSPDPRDGRRVNLYLTEAGTSLAHQLLDVRRTAVDRMLGKLNDTECQVLEGLVSKMLEAATVDRAEAERLCRLCELTACPLSTCPVDAAATRWEAEHSPRRDGHP